MRIDKIAKGLLSVVLIAFAVCTLSACFNLGNGTTDDDDYREVYSSVTLIGSDSSVERYSMADFYNKETADSFACPIAAEDKKEYAYVAISVGRTLALGEVAVFFETDTDVDLGVTFFVSDKLPSKIYNGAGGDYDADECDEPNDDSFGGKAGAKLMKNKWRDVSLKTWTNADGEAAKRLSVTEGSYLILRIDNNTYSALEKEYESAKKEVDDLAIDLNDKKANYSQLVDSSASASSIAEAKDAVDRAQEAFDVAENKLRDVETRYSNDKERYERANIRLTKILIYADRV